MNIHDVREAIAEATAMISYYSNLLETQNERMATLRIERRAIELREAQLQRDIDRAPKVIEEYRERLSVLDRRRTLMTMKNSFGRIQKTPAMCLRDLRMQAELLEMEIREATE